MGIVLKMDTENKQVENKAPAPLKGLASQNRGKIRRVPISRWKPESVSYSFTASGDILIKGEVTETKQAEGQYGYRKITTILEQLVEVPKFVKNQKLHNEIDFQVKENTNEPGKNRLLIIRMPENPNKKMAEKSDDKTE